jgi:hypothetical protein
MRPPAWYRAYIYGMALSGVPLGVAWGMRPGAPRDWESIGTEVWSLWSLCWPVAVGAIGFSLVSWWFIVPLRGTPPPGLGAGPGAAK